MAYIISKNSKRDGKVTKLYYLVEGYRENGKSKRRTIVRLDEGKNIEEALDIVSIRKRQLKDSIVKLENDLENPRPFFGNLGSYIRVTLKFIEQDKRKIVSLEKWEQRLNQARKKYNL